MCLEVFYPVMDIKFATINVSMHVILSSFRDTENVPHSRKYKPKRICACKYKSKKVEDEFQKDRLQEHLKYAYVRRSHWRTSRLARTRRRVT